jgi:hypothetical protein
MTGLLYILSVLHYIYYNILNCKITCIYVTYSQWSVAMHFAPGSAGFVFSSGVNSKGRDVLFYNRKGHVFGLKFLTVRRNLLGIF